MATKAKRGGSAKDTRKRLLDAAEGLILEAGPKALVLDEVARRAAVSKGGLLYHFGSKRALVDGLLDRLIARLQEQQSRQAEAEASAPGGWTRAYLDATVTSEGAPADQSARLLAALLVNFGEDTDALAPLRLAFGRWQEEIERGAEDPVEATIVRLAADGLWMSQLLGLNPLPARLGRAVVAKLKERTRQSS
ncbi:MAG: TetR/AcrR family transcriptional regulator [Deltaproteobacteria bacterium]